MENNVTTSVGQNFLNTLVPPIFTGKAEEWVTFSKRFEWYRQASGLSESSNARQVSTLMYILGQQADDLLNSFNLSESEKLDYNTVFEKFNTYYTSNHNKIHARAKFNKLCQEPNERIDDYIAKVYSAAELCKYPQNIKEELIRDRIIVGINNLKLSNNLQMDPNISLETVLLRVKQSEEVIRQQLNIRPSTSFEEINKIESNKQRNTTLPEKTQGKNYFSKDCGRCGKSPSHSFTVCPAKRSICSKCNRKGHWANKCRTVRIINELEKNYSENDENKNDNLFLGNINDDDEAKVEFINGSDSNDPWRINLRIKDKYLSFKIDSGADVTAIGDKHIKELNVILKPTQNKLKAAAEGHLNVLGKFNCEIIWKNKIVKSDIYVIKNLEYPLLGKPAIESLGIINRINIVSNSILIDDNNAVNNFNPENEFPNLFIGLGKLKGEYKICINDNAKPYSIPYTRRVAIPLYEPLKKELKILTEQNVIFSVVEPTEYCAGIVVRPKEDGTVRLCVDYTELNKNIKRSRLQLPSVDECLAQIGDAKYFSKLDANKGYFQLPLETKSQLLTTFITPFGRFAFKRMPMGIACASEVFQNKIQSMLEGIEGVICCQDDILIFGSNIIMHDKRLKEVLQRIQKEGITLNKNKCQFRVTECTFLGHKISKNGISPCPKKIEAILNMPKPSDISTVRSLLGMINYHLKFFPNLASITKPIRDLLKIKDKPPKDKSISWNDDCEQSFECIKKQLINSSSLALFDPKKPIRVTSDASSYGIGGVIEQYDTQLKYWKPISYASRSLSSTEKNYAQIDKEALALTWVCEKFSMYLIGLPTFELRTDHQPLIKIIGSKPIADLTARMQRYRMRLSNFSFKISHVPGKYLHTADLLSRSPLPIYDEKRIENDNEVSMATMYQIQCIPMSDVLLNEIIQAQENDNSCVLLKNYILNGWPNKNNLNNEIKQFNKYRGELGLQNNIIMKGHRIFIPVVLQKDMLKRLHQGHLGVDKCRNRARESVWWPGISCQIRTMVQQCPQCIELRNNPTEPMITSEIPQHPWEIVAVDLFCAKQQNYMVIIDYFSRYPELATLRSTTSPAIIMHLKIIFARFGVPRELRTDNGPQFTSAEFGKFASEWGFKHITSSPHAHWSNGMAEAGVKILKNIINKSSEPILGLMAYRSTPSVNGYSPSQLLFGRRIRTNIPIQIDRLIPECPDLKIINEKEKQRKQKMASNFNKRHRTRYMSELLPGMRVWDKILKTYATIKMKRNEPRSYMLETERGNIIRRNSRHLIVANNNVSNNNMEYYSYGDEILKQTPEVVTAVPVSENVNRYYTTRSGRMIRPPNKLNL